MPRNGRKSGCDDQQQSLLLLSRKQRLEAVKAIDPGDLGIGRRAWANIVDLLTQIEVCSGPDGCFAYAKTLAARMRVGAGVSRATLFRTSKLARELSLLESFGRVTRQGTQSNDWRVNWQRVSLLAKRTGWDAQAVRESPPYSRKTETGVAQSETGASQTETPLIGIVSRQSCPSKTSRPPDGGDESTRCVWDRELILEGVWELRSKLGQMKSIGDWNLAVKLVRLTQTAYAPQWLWGPAEAARAKRNPWAWLNRTLRDQSEQLGRNYRQDLAKLTIPAELAKPIYPQVDPLEQRKERLCISSEE